MQGRPYWISDRHTKTQIWESMLRTCFLSSFVKIHSVAAEEKSKNVSANQRPGQPSWISDQHKNTSFIEDIEDLLAVKFRQNLFGYFGEEVKKCFSQSEARTAILDFRSAQKSQTWKSTLRTCFLSSFVKIHSVVAEEKSKNCSANQRPGQPSWISDQHEKHKLERVHWGLASCQVSSKSIQRLRRWSSKMFQPIRGHDGHLGFPIGTKNTNLKEYVEDLLPVKFFFSKSIKRLRRTSRTRGQKGLIPCT